MDKYMNASIILSKFSRDYIELKKYLPIRPSEMAVINIITQHKNKFTPLMIAEMLGVSKQMLTSHVAVLSEKGYIIKEQSKKDKRSFFIIPTEKAIMLADEFNARQTENIKKIEESLGEEDFDKLIDMMSKVQTTLDGLKKEGIKNAK